MGKLLLSRRLPFELLLVMHSLYVASLFRRTEYTRFWPALFWVSFIAAFGSGSLVNICFHDYPAWLRSDAILLTYAVCWYLVLFSPGDVVFKVYNMLPIRVSILLYASYGLGRTVAVTSVRIFFFFSFEKGQENEPHKPILDSQGPFLSWFQKRDSMRSPPPLEKLLDVVAISVAYYQRLKNNGFSWRTFSEVV